MLYSPLRLLFQVIGSGVSHYFHHQWTTVSRSIRKVRARGGKIFVSCFMAALVHSRSLSDCVNASPCRELMMKDISDILTASRRFFSLHTCVVGYDVDLSFLWSACCDKPVSTTAQEIPFAHSTFFCFEG